MTPAFRSGSPLPPLRWVLACMFATAVHAGVVVPAVMSFDRLDESIEDRGVPMVVEVADLTAAPSDESAEEASEQAAQTSPVREVEEKKSTAAETDIPQVEASQYDAAPDLTLAQQSTQRTQEAAQTEQTTEAQEARDETPPVSASAAASGAAGAPILADVATAAAVGSADVARKAVDTWQRKVLAHLARHKRYPEDARTRRAEGEVLVSFRVERNGRISDPRVEKTSGVAALDLEALAMLERAQPAPAFPALADTTRSRLIVPIRYRLK